jgi:hypothetical protein
MHSTVPVDWTVRTCGENANADWLDRIYLTDDAALIRPTSCSQPFRPVSDSADQGPVHGPAEPHHSVRTGRKVPLFVIDSDQRQEETDETNNVLAHDHDFRRTQTRCCLARRPVAWRAGRYRSPDRDESETDPAAASWTDQSFRPTWF